MSGSRSTRNAGDASETEGATLRIVLGTTVDVSLDLMRGFPGYLVERAWDVHVVSSGGPRLAALGNRAGITVHSLPMERPPNLRADVKALASWVRLLRRIRPHVVAVGTPKAGLLSMVASAWTGVGRRIYILRGLRLETATGAAKGLLFAMEWVAMACSHVVLAVSPSLKARVVGMHLSSTEKIVVLGGGSSNGVDLDAPSAPGPALESEQAIEPGIPIVGFVGRIAADKGLNRLGEALNLMRQSGLRCQLLLVGQLDEEGSERIIESLLNSGQKVIRCGYLADPRAAYETMDVICLPSLREGFPNVILEAAAAGRPAVVSDATGNVDAVVNGVTGYVVPVHDEYALAAALAQLLTDQRLRHRMGNAARARVAENFQRRDVWQRTDALFRDISTVRPNHR